MKYIDTNIFGYAIEMHHTYGKTCKHILEDIQNGKLQACCSVLVLGELIGVIKKFNKVRPSLGLPLLNIREHIDAVLSLPIIWFDLEVFIIKHAADYTYPLPGADCLHLATMDVHSVGEIISADSDFNKIPTIKRIDPLGYRP